MATTVTMTREQAMAIVAADRVRKQRARDNRKARLAEAKRIVAQAKTSK